MLRNVRYRLLALAGLVLLLAACGKPPEPPLSAPPGGPGSAPPAGSAYPLPSGFTVPAPGPTGTLPPTTLPTVPYVPPATLAPVATTTPAPARTTTPTSTTPPAPRCVSGPTAAQLLAVLKGLPGIPEEELAVAEGPFCSGAWQFATVQIAGEDPKEAEQIFVVSTGTPTALKVVEAGTDVCSVEVQTQAPAGIRVRACGA